MGLPTEVLKAWEACDRTDTLFVLVCCVFCMSAFIPVPIVLEALFGHFENDFTSLTTSSIRYES